MNLLTVLPFHRGDLSLAQRLLGWIVELGGRQEHDLLLVWDKKLRVDETATIVEAGKKAFKGVVKTTTPWSMPDETWPKGANWMFETALKTAKAFNRPFLWLEPDCLPLKTGWLEKIKSDYEKSGSAFMGMVYRAGHSGLPEKVMSGVGVYPADAHQRLSQRLQQTRMKLAFDVGLADLIVPEARNSKLIWHFFGEVGLPPTFVRKKEATSPRNALEVKVIPKQAVLAHRVKDGSLVEILRSKS